MPFSCLLCTYYHKFSCEVSHSFKLVTEHLLVLGRITDTDSSTSSSETEGSCIWSSPTHTLFFLPFCPLPLLNLLSLLHHQSLTPIVDVLPSRTWAASLSFWSLRNESPLTSIGSSLSTCSQSTAICTPSTPPCSLISQHLSLVAITIENHSI